MPRHVKPEGVFSYELESALTESGVGLIQGTADGQAKLPAAGGESNIVGVWQNETASIGDRVSLVEDGYVEARVNAASPNIARGDFLKVAVTTGRWVKAGTDKDFAYLQALESASADGVLISARIVRTFVAV